MRRNGTVNSGVTTRLLRCPEKIITDQISVNSDVKMLKKVCNELSEWIAWLLRFLPGNVGSKLRYYYYRHRFAKCGSRINIQAGFSVRGLKNIILGSDVGIGLYAQLYATGNGSERIAIGDHVFLNSNVMINADLGGVVRIGSHCMVGPNVVFRTSDHVFSNIDALIIEQGHASGTIVIEDNVWIGANVVLTGNIRIGSGAVIGAGAVVTRDVEPFAIVAGVPAKPIGTRIENEGPS